MGRPATRLPGEQPVAPLRHSGQSHKTDAIAIGERSPAGPLRPATFVKASAPSILAPLLCGTSATLDRNRRTFLGAAGLVVRHTRFIAGHESLRRSGGAR